MAFFSRVAEELDSVIARDPAARGRVMVALLYPSVHVMAAYRLAHPLWRWQFRFLARWIMQLARWLTGIEIHPAARIGKRFFIDHGMGVVIGETSEIGDDVTFYHGVTLGGTLPSVDSDSQRTVKRHPTIRDGVIIGCGAQILGPVTVGENARIGANSVVVRDIADNVTVIGIPAREVVSHAERADPGFRPYGAADETLKCTQEAAISGLLDEVQSLRARLNALDHKDPSVETEAASAPASAPVENPETASKADRADLS